MSPKVEPIKKRRSWFGKRFDAVCDLVIKACTVVVAIATAIIYAVTVYCILAVKTASCACALALAAA
jgi:phosphatidylglycerophosphate synthase